MHGANFKDFRYSLWTMWRRECQLETLCRFWFLNGIAILLYNVYYCENCAILGSNIGKINNVPHRLLFLMLPSYLLTYRLYLAFGDLYTSELKIWKNSAIIYCMNCDIKEVISSASLANFWNTKYFLKNLSICTFFGF